MDKIKSMWHSLGAKQDIVYTRKWVKGIRYIIAIFVLLTILLSPLQMVGQATDQITIKEILPQPEDQVGLDVYNAGYRYAVENYCHKYQIK